MAEVAKQDVADRKRSPSFPTLPLEDAIEKVRVLYQQDKGAAITAEVMATHWKSKITSSAFMQWVASLKRFGLLVDAGHRQLKVSPLAVDILLLPDDDPRKTAKIKEAALQPKAHHDLWNEYGLSKIPSDASLRHKLVTSQGFQPNSADDLIAQYKKTLAFAKLADGDKIGETPGDDAKETQKNNLSGSSFGDVFQQLFKPVKNPLPDVQKRQNQAMQGEVKQDTFTLDEGQVVLQWPAQLGEDSYADLKDWIDLQMRKIRRSVSPRPSGSENTDPDQA